MPKETDKNLNTDELAIYYYLGASVRHWINRTTKNEWILQSKDSKAGHSARTPNSFITLPLPSLLALDKQSQTQEQRKKDLGTVYLSN